MWSVHDFAFAAVHAGSHNLAVVLADRTLPTTKSAAVVEVYKCNDAHDLAFAAARRLASRRYIVLAGRPSTAGDGSAALPRLSMKSKLIAISVLADVRAGTN